VAVWRCLRAGRWGSEADLGTSPAATDAGSEESPIRWPATWLASHATEALATIPSNAPAITSAVRRITTFPR
jgi:hypothetical protein